MQCPRCSTSLEERATFCGNCGALIKPQSYGAVETIDERASVRPTAYAPKETQPTFYVDQPAPRPAVDGYHAGRNMLDPTIRVSSPASSGDDDADTVTAEYRYSQSAPRVIAQKPALAQVQHFRRNLLIATLLIIVVVAGVIGGSFVFGSKGSTITLHGQVTFSDSAADALGRTDALSITVSGLSVPAGGTQYQAWLIDTTSEQVLALGALHQSANSFALVYPAPGAGRQRVNLLGLGNEIEITQEQGNVTAPTGNVVLTGTLPPQAFVHIRHLLVSFPTTPGKIGLLVGLLNEIQKINAQAFLLQNSQADGKNVLVQCSAQGIINIAEGKAGADYQRLSQGCLNQGIPDLGDGFGLLDKGYIATSEAHAVLAATQPDSTATIRLYAKNVEDVMNTIKPLVSQINQDAVILLANPTQTQPAAEILTLADRAYHGFDQNADSRIDPTAGEGGALTAYAQGQLMATLPLS